MKKFLCLLLCCVSLFGVLPVQALEEITSVAVSVTAPAAGSSPVLEASVPEGAMYTVEAVEWSTADTFAPGQSYRVSVTLAAKADAAFHAQVTGTVNGAACSVELVDSIVVLRYDFQVAGQTVSRVSLTGLTKPVAGAMPDMSLDVPADALYSVEQVAWIGWNTAEGMDSYVTLSPGDTFSPGYSYQIAVLLKAKDGGTFSLDSQGNPQVTVTIDGEAAHSGTAVSGKEPSQYILTGRVFQLEGAKKAIDKVEITDIVPPSIGKKPNLLAKVPSGALYTVDKVIWKQWKLGFPEPVAMGSRETFAAGSDYQVTVILKAKEDCAFTLDSFDRPTVNATLNGNPADLPVSAENQAPEQYISVSYNFRTAEDLITDISIFGLEEPEQGQLPDFKIDIPSNAGYIVESVVWQWKDPETPNAQYSKMTYSDVFATGKQYQISVILTADEDAEFATNGVDQPQVTVKFNNEPAKPAAAVKDRDPVQCVEVSFEYLLESDVAVIERVALEDLELPVAGNKPDMEATVSSVAKYQVYELTWERLSDGKALKIDRNYTFRAGEKYRVTVVLKAKENGEFAVSSTGRIQVSAALNGKTVTPTASGSRDTKNYIAISGEFFIYTVIEGDGAQWTPQKESLRFRFSGETENFEGLQVDGAVVKESFYTVSNGSVVIELSSRFLSALKDGTHQLTALYTDGVATTEFEVYNDGSVPSAEEDPGGGNLWLLMIPLMIVLLCGAIVLSIFLRKKGWL